MHENIEKIAKQITAKSELERWTKKEYADYSYGNPIGAAKNLMIILKDIEKHLKTAGHFLSPGMKNAFIKDVQKIKI